MKTISLAIVEDDAIIRESLSTFLGGDPQFDLQLAAVSVEEFLSAVGGNPMLSPAVVLLDIQLPGMSGIEGIPHIKKLLPEVSIIMLTTFIESDKIFAALCAGACSYLAKSVSLLSIRDAIITVSRGGSYMSPGIARKVVEYFTPKPNKIDSPLTSRQLEIAQCIVDGLSYKLVAARLDISLDTVRTHIKNIYQILEINSKGELIRKSFNREV